LSHLTSSAASHRAQQIEAERVKLLYTQAPIGFVVTVLNAGVVVFILWGSVARSLLIAWLVLIVTITLLRLALVQRYRRAAATADQVRSWRTLFILGAGAAGMAWGAVGLLLFIPELMAHQVFLAFVLGGMAAGAVGLLSSVRTAFLAFFIPTVLPIIVRFFVQGGTIPVAMGFLGLFFAGALLAIARNFHASIVESLNLRFENYELIRSLSFAREQAEAATHVAKQAEEALRQAYQELEKRVEERTAELSTANALLRQEIAERQRAEEELIRSSMAVKMSTDSIVICDLAGNISDANEATLKMYGTTEKGDLLGKSAFELIVPEERTKAIAGMEETLDKGFIQNREYKISIKDGRTIPVEMSVALMKGPGGKVMGFVGISRDITARKQAEEELLKAKEAAEAANRVKSEFLATMSHELRTPLSVILGYGSLLVEGMLGSLSEEQSHSLRRINNSARELLDLITAILDVSRLEAGRLPMEIKIVEVPTLLEEIKAETEAERERVDLIYTWTIQGELPPLYTDRDKLKIVLKNLIRNAVKFTKEGSVTVEAQGLCGGIEVRVIDTGIGIPVEALELIFEPFRQVGTVSSGGRGIGLGLHIVKRLLALLGGTIRVESKLGAGSTFRVWMPREHSISLNVPSDVAL